jgi:hypothetical protein
MDFFIPTTILSLFNSTLFKSRACTLNREEAVIQGRNSGGLKHTRAEQ